MVELDEDEMMAIVEKVLEIPDELHRGYCLIALTASNDHNFMINIHSWLLGRGNRSPNVLGPAHFDFIMNIVGEYSDKFGESLYGMCNRVIHGQLLRKLSIKLSWQMPGRSPVSKNPSSYEKRFREIILELPIFYTGDNTSFNGVKNTRRPDFICLDNRSGWFAIEVFATYHRLRKGSRHKSVSDYLHKRRNDFDMPVLAFDETVFMDTSDSIMKSFVQFLIAIHFDGVHLKNSFVQ